MNHLPDHFRPGWLGLVALLALLSPACGRGPAPVEPGAGATAPIVVPPPPTSPVTPGLGGEPTASTPTPILGTPLPDLARLADELAILASDLVPPTPTPDPAGSSFMGLEGVTALPLGPDEQGRLLFAVHSFGFRGLEPPKDHLVAVYAYDNGWVQVAVTDVPEVDWVFRQTVTGQPANGGGYWIQVSSGVGAHGHCYHLLRYDPTGTEAGPSLEIALSHCHSTIASEGLTDLNGDGWEDLVLNQTVDYVFCYACGVQLPAFDVYNWDGSAWRRADLLPLPETAPEAWRRVNDEAVALARAGFWQEAGALADQLDPGDPIMAWNRILLNLHVSAFEEKLAGGSYPLLNHLFYGDYAGALAQMRPYPPAQLFAVDSPLITGTVAEGWPELVGQWVVETTEAGLALRPELAGAYFLRAWGKYLQNPEDPSVVTDLERADALDPADPLLADTLFYFYNDVQYRSPDSP